MNIRISLLWRTVILLTVFVVISQVMVYFWIQRSVKSHFEVMDAEVLTHAAFNLRKSNKVSDSTSALEVNQSHSYHEGLDYNIKVFKFNRDGQPFTDSFDIPSINVLELMETYGDKQFEWELGDRAYRSIIISIDDSIYLLALPIDVHHLYLHQFSLQLKLILFAMTLLLVFIAALSVYWGFSPLTTFIQKMTGISFEQLGERITVADMPSELRPLAESYNIMMDKLEESFESLSRYSDNIAHELRTPIATLSTQTQVMLSKPRQTQEYVEQLHHQHETLEHLSDVINNLLLLAKTQRGLSHEQLQDVNTDELMTKLVDYYEMLAEDREIDLVKSGEFATIQGDRGLLQRLFSNLISNAIYYSKSHSTIDISAQVKQYSRMEDASVPVNKSRGYQSSLASLASLAKTPSLIITIENEVLEPLTSKEANRLFERFYRLSDKKATQSSQHQHLGTGLGLSIVKSIASAHSGEVTVCFEGTNVKMSVVLPILGSHQKIK